MFRPASRSILRSAQGFSIPALTAARRRFLSTAPPHQKSRSFKSTAARWGLAIAGVYYYNTSELFAEQPAEYRLDPKADDDDSNIPTLDAITQSSRENKRKQQIALAPIAPGDDGTVDHASTVALQPETEAIPGPSPSNPADLEEEASSEGAFNPATGEINWDCPCLGGMAHGPCGEEFRAAFSCFVFSEEQVKGMDCIDKFQGMQECFRAHPDVYAAELEGDDNEELDEGLEEERQELVKEIEERREKAGKGTVEPVNGKRLLEADPPVERKPLLKRSPAPAPALTPPSTTPPSSSETPVSTSGGHEADVRLEDKPLPSKRQNGSNPETASEPVSFDEKIKLVPKDWHDSRSGSNSSKKTDK